MKSLERKTNNLVTFDYNILTQEEKLKTLENEKKLIEIFERYQPEVGEVLYNQQQVLANHDDGVFKKWYTSLGFKRWKVYDYINRYKYVFRNSEDPHKIEIFSELPSSLQSEMSKPSALPEVNQAVFDGDITTHKEYKEMEKRLKEKDAIIARQAETIDLKNNTIAEKDDIIYRQGEQKTQVIEIEKEVIPSDYEKIKKENERLHETKEHLTKQLEKVSSDLELAETKYHLEKESSEKAKALKQEIERLSKQEKTLNDKIKAFYEFNDLEDEFNKFFDTKMAPLRFKNLANYMVNTNAVDRIWNMINQAEHWAEEMKKVVPNKNMKIVEGEIIND